MESYHGKTCINKIMKRFILHITKKIKWPENMPLKLLDWYIIKKFLGTYVFAIVLILSIAFSVWLLGRREKLPLAALIVSLIAYFVTYGCMVLIMPLKEKGDKSDQPAAARRRDR